MYNTMKGDCDHGNIDRILESYAAPAGTGLPGQERFIASQGVMGLTCLGPLRRPARQLETPRWQPQRGRLFAGYPVVTV
jgi:hypothetical protein